MIERVMRYDVPGIKVEYPTQRVTTPKPVTAPKVDARPKRGLSAYELEVIRLDVEKRMASIREQAVAELLAAQRSREDQVDDGGYAEQRAAHLEHERALRDRLAKSFMR